MLAVVEYEEGCSGCQVVLHDVHPRAVVATAAQSGLGRSGDLDLFGDPVRKPFRFGETRHLRHPDAIREVIEHLGCGLQRQARLP